jgi:hypothetical protein
MAYQRPVLSLLVTALAAPSCSSATPTESSAIPHLGAVAAPIVAGTDAPNTNGIVSVYSRITMVTCTAALVSENVVLTTGRCVTGSTDPCCHDFGASFDPTNFEVRTSAVLDPSADFLRVARVIMPPGKEVCGNDVALLVLESPVPPSQATPLGLRFSALSESESVTVFGYGPTSPNGLDPGHRRKREDVPVSCAARCDGAAPSEWISGAGLCAADGAAVDASGAVVGIASRLTADCGPAVFESLGAHAAFLRREVALATPSSRPAWTFADGGSSVDADAGALDPSLCVAPLGDPPSSDAGASSGGPNAAHDGGSRAKAITPRSEGCALGRPDVGPAPGSDALALGLLLATLLRRRAKQRERD